MPATFSGGFLLGCGEWIVGGETKSIMGGGVMEGGCESDDVFIEAECISTGEVGFVVCGRCCRLNVMVLGGETSCLLLLFSGCWAFSVLLDCTSPLETGVTGLEGVLAREEVGLTLCTTVTKSDGMTYCCMSGSSRGNVQLEWEHTIWCSVAKKKQWWCNGVNHCCYLPQFQPPQSRNKSIVIAN